MSERTDAEKKKAKEMVDAAFKRILDKLATVDGIATADAIELGMLIKDYGDCRSVATIADILGPMMGSILEKPSESWKGGTPQ